MNVKFNMRSLKMVSLLLAMLFVTAFVAAAHAAASWYLMAPDESVVGVPQAADRMSRGSVAGPFEFTSRGGFASRDECEASRNHLIEDWRGKSLIKRGSWDKHGMMTPSGFIRCVAATDPHLKKAKGAGGTPSMEIFLRGKPRR